VSGRDSRASWPLLPVASRDGFERRIEGKAQIKLATEAAELDDLDAYRKCRDQLRSLHRLRLIRQHREPPIHASFPILGRPRDRLRREAAQIAQRQREQSTRAKCGRERRQQAKRKRRGPYTPNDRQRGIVKLSSVVAHEVGGRE